jgi:hypothetical protein
VEAVTPPTSSRYDAVAQFYRKGWTDVVDDPVTSALLDAVGDVAHLDDDSCDVVVCSFALSDIDDLDGALATVARVLRGSTTSSTGTQTTPHRACVVRSGRTIACSRPT